MSKRTLYDFHDLLLQVKCSFHHYRIVETQYVYIRYNPPTQTVVYALFTQKHKKSSYECANCLIFNVDHLGLEPGTSRL